MPGGLPVDDDGAGILRQPLARQRGEKFVLAVAGDAGDAEDFATLELEGNVLKPHAVRIVRRKAEVVDDQPRHRGLPVGGSLHLPDLAADHHARERGRGLRLGIAGRDLLAAAQDGGGVAEPLHLVQLVADVEDRAALGLEAIEHDEELIGLLRRQHRGRLVEDQEFRILHQRAHDLDALAFADRQLPDLAPGIERKPVNAGYFFKARRHVLEGFLAVESERDVFRHGEIVEQREMLEHHADAAAARFRWSGEHHLLALPAHFAFARLDQSVDDLDERRFAGAVLAEQRVDLLRPDIDVDRLIGEERAIALGQANRLEQRRGTGVHRRRRI